MGKRLRHWLSKPNDALLWLSMIAGILMMLHVTIDVTGRTFFNRPLAGTTETVSAYYMVAVAFLPWAWVAQRNQHIDVDLVVRLLPVRVTRWLDVFVRLATAAYVSLFTWQAVVSALRQTRSGEVWEIPRGFLPIWPARWILPLAGLFMVLAVLASLWPAEKAETTETSTGDRA